MKIKEFCRNIIGFFSRYEAGDQVSKPDPIYLMTADYEIIKSYESDIRVSQIVCHQLDAAGDEKYALIFYFPGVTTDILHFIIKFGEFHKGDERRKERAKRREIRKGIQTTGPSDFRKDKNKPEPGYWDKKFMESIKSTQMHALWEASLSLDIPTLKDLILIYTAFSLRDKNDDQLRSLLGIERDIDEKEEVEIHNQAAFLANGN